MIVLTAVEAAFCGLRFARFAGVSGDNAMPLGTGTAVLELVDVDEADALAIGWEGVVEAAGDSDG